IVLEWAVAREVSQLCLERDVPTDQLSRDSSSSLLASSSDYVWSTHERTTGARARAGRPVRVHYALAYERRYAKHEAFVHVLLLNHPEIRNFLPKRHENQRVLACLIRELPPRVVNPFWDAKTGPSEKGYPRVPSTISSRLTSRGTFSSLSRLATAHFPVLLSLSILHAAGKGFRRGSAACAS
ncbi:hypothetical protein X777_01958, partial [Ooceraea biroi]